MNLLAFGSRVRWRSLWRRIGLWSLSLAIALSLWLAGPVSPARADLDNDRYDGNIFVVYAGNGSLVPPKLSLADSIRKQRPAIVVYYIDDSRDCKEFALVVSRLQRGYGRAASFIPIDVDSLLPRQEEYAPDDAGYYYAGVVPQVVVTDQDGEVVFNETGQVAYEAIDASLREVFELLPRSETLELKRRSFNEFNAELKE